MDQKRIIGRNEYIDYLKGIAIFFVLWGHSIQYLSYGADEFWNDRVFSGIYSFHMPLFIFLSGYVFYYTCEKYDLKKIMINRLRGLGIPMFFWGTLNFLLSLRGGMPATIIEGIKQWEGEILGIWFLWAVFVSSSIVAVVYKFNRHLVIRILFAPLMVGIIFLLPGKDGNLFVFPYFVIGFLFCKFKILETGIYFKIKWIIILMWLVLLHFYSKKHYIYITGLFSNGSNGIIDQLKIDLFRYIIGLCGTIAIMEIFRFFYTKKENHFSIKWILYGGKHSLDIYVMQRIFLERWISTTFKRMVDISGINYLKTNVFIFDFFITSACALFCYIVLTNISKLVEKSDVFSFILFGRRNSR